MTDDSPPLPGSDAELLDGSAVRIRPVARSDGPGLVDLHRSLSPRSIRNRYFSPRRELPQSQIDLWTHVDFDGRVGLVAERGGELIGHASYDREIGTNDAEVAFEVRESCQGLGVATLLLDHLAEAAWRAGIRRFVARVLPDNERMLQVFRDAGLQIHSAYDSGAVRMVLDLDGHGGFPRRPHGEPV